MRVTPDTYTLEGKAKSGIWKLLYAGPAPGDQCLAELTERVKEGRFLEFNVKRWEAGDSDGDFYTADGRLMP
jgi:hypothetical protein